MSIEAMKQALEALEDWKTYMHGHWDVIDEQAITSLRQAIAESEKHEVSQEPVQVTIKDFVKAVEGKEDMVGRPVYWAQWPNADTHPQPKREQDGDCQHCGGKGCVACDAREQEPVMWVMPDGKTVDKWGLQFYGGQTGKPLYTQPPKREWVGLTDEEREELMDNYDVASPDYAQAIEAKLKEKNGIKGEA